MLLLADEDRIDRERASSLDHAMTTVERTRTASSRRVLRLCSISTRSLTIRNVRLSALRKRLLETSVNFNLATHASWFDGAAQVRPRFAGLAGRSWPGTACGG